MASPFKKTALLSGHTESVHSLAISSDGRTLASGGLDRVRLWDIHSAKERRTPEQGLELRGPPSAMIWARRRDDHQHVLAFGTALGYLVIWQSIKGDFEEATARRVANGAEIISLAWDSANEATLRLANGARDGTVQLWTFNGKDLHCNFSVRLTCTIPRAVAFMDNPESDLYVFGTYSGYWHILGGTDGKVKATRDLKKLVGHASVSVVRNQFVVDVGKGCFHVHQLDNGAFLWALNTKANGNLPKHAEFAEEARSIVCGSDHGTVYVFGRKSTLTHVLKHAEEGLCQTVTVYGDERSTIIAAATSGGSRNVAISIWRSHVEGGELAPAPPPVPAPASANAQAPATSTSFVDKLIRLVVVGWVLWSVVQQVLLTEKFQEWKEIAINVTTTYRNLPSMNQNFDELDRLVNDLSNFDERSPPRREFSNEDVESVRLMYIKRDSQGMETPGATFVGGNEPASDTEYHVTLD